MKRQQAAEDAIAMGLRAVATGQPMNGYLPPGPIFGMPVTEPLKHDIENTDQNMLNSDSGDDGNESANESAEESDRNKSNEESSGKKFLFIQ